jgi:hypothetical protein
VFAEQALELSKNRKLSCYSKFIKTIVHCTTKNAAAYSKEYIKINDSLQKAEIGEKFICIEYENR